MLANDRIKAGYSYSTILPDMDFETYSEAGFRWDETANKWKSTVNTTSASSSKGIKAVGAAVYSEHPTCEVLSLAYNLKDGKGPRLWIPGMPPPEELFNHVQNGGLIEAWNSAFEYHIWTNVCHARMGWPVLPLHQLRDAAAKSRGFSMPGKLEDAAKAINSEQKKDPEGMRLLTKFSMPRNPTKNNLNKRILPAHDPVDANKLYDYCLQDIATESSISEKLPDLIPNELELWLCDQSINMRGCKIDLEALSACVRIVKDTTDALIPELQTLTGGAVNTAGELDRMKAWLATLGVGTNSLKEEVITELLKRGDLPPAARRVLEIRQTLGSASVKKLDAITRYITKSGRIKDTFMFCGADRTGRWAGRGPQPHNLPNSGPAVLKCECGAYYVPGSVEWCPFCSGAFSAVKSEWGVEAVEQCLTHVKTFDHRQIANIYGDPIKAVSGCLRGLFCAEEGYDLICSDYSAIEAVVLAALAREEWRMEVFRTHGKIYEMSAAKITGVPFEDFLKHKEETGSHHPLRKKIGKVAELASGYQGWVGAWKNFGADKHMNEDEIKNSVIAWRDESPNIVNFWKSAEQTVIAAIQYPGNRYEINGMYFGVKDDVLYIRLLSGRMLCYHSPRVAPKIDSWGRSRLQITYMGMNSDYKKGPRGWMRLDTYGGKLTENIVQATARDILAFAIVNLERSNYPIVLHVHDEIISEIPKGTGSIEEFEKIMATMPAWCSDWPIKAAGGWRGKRYRKD